MRDLRFAAIGAGFWSQFQLHGWHTIGGTQCVAICDQDGRKAQAVADRFGIPKVYLDAETMFQTEELDFVDIITSAESHAALVRRSACHRVPAICQKPMAISLLQAEEMVDVCRQAGVPLYINENWRWQSPIREVHRLLSTDVIGVPFRARISMISGFPVFSNQPALRELEQFILTDLGSHLLDVSRFLFGEPCSIYCQTQRVHPDIRGEDVATIVIRTEGGMTVVVEMAYAENFVERERFPETFLLMEGDKGSIEIDQNYLIRVTTKEGTQLRRVPPPRYAWADPAYDIVHASIVPCQANLLRALRGEGKAETDAEDNLRTIRMVYGCYQSAALNQSVSLSGVQH